MKTFKTLGLISLTMLITLITASLFAQKVEDTTDGRFHSDLLNHLVGKWYITSIAHGHPFTSNLEAKWILNHQFLHIHLKSHQVIPWWHVQMEYEEFIGYNPTSKRYVFHGMSIEGGNDPSDGFGFGYRNGNEFKTVGKFGSDSLIVQRFTWIPQSNSWHVTSNWVIAGKEGEVFLDMKLVAVKPTSKNKKVLSK
jgi:hypothetical protein